MNHKTRQKQNPTNSNTLLAVAALSFLTALAMSVFFVPNQKHQASASGELNLDHALQVCTAAAPATRAYANCKVMVETIAAQRTPPPPPNLLNPPYKVLANCKDAVDYIFQDRVDYPRAIKVVYRESTYNPNARRPGSQYAGCAQLSNTLQRLFLKGPWNDPYYNVLALRDAVDNKHWGWCHWDLVNYCLPGGEF